MAALLLLVLLGVPTMACLLPDAHLTDEEKACCRAMSNDCGSMDMGTEHSCCQKVVQHHDSALVKEISTTIHADLSVQVAFTPVQLYLPFANASQALNEAAWHAPPFIATSSIEILRI